MNQIKMLSDFVRIFWKDKPVDWLLDQFIRTKVCNPQKDAHECQKEKRKIYKIFKPSQFQHMGKHSSLDGKRQNLRDFSFRLKPSELKQWFNKV